MHSIENAQSSRSGVDIPDMDNPKPDKNDRLARRRSGSPKRANTHYSPSEDAFIRAALALSNGNHVPLIADFLARLTGRNSSAVQQRMYAMRKAPDSTAPPQVSAPARDEGELRAAIEATLATLAHLESLVLSRPS